MDIDLLFTNQGKAGLVANENFMKKAVGAILDTQTGLISIEYSDMDVLETNIPVDPEYFETLDYNPILQIGAVKGGNIAQAYQIPLMFADDPYRNQNNAHIQPPKNPLIAFEHFVTSCKVGQPVYRDDLGDESTMGCILGDASPASLEFAPHLARRHKMEVAPTLAPGNVPGLGLGGSGGGNASRGQSGRGNYGDNSNGDQNK